MKQFLNLIQTAIGLSMICGLLWLFSSLLTLQAPLSASSIQQENSLIQPPFVKSSPYPPPAVTSTSPAYPSPTTAPSPTTTPTLPPSVVVEPTLRQLWSLLTYRPQQTLPNYEVVVDTKAATALLRHERKRIHFSDPQLLKHAEFKGEEKNQTVGNWERLHFEDFEDGFINSPCNVYDENEDYEYQYWGADDYRAFNGSNLAAWPARDGTHGVDPANSPVPNGLRSWLVCGPFDSSDADQMMVEFAVWKDEIEDNDYFFFGTAVDDDLTDGINFQGTRWFNQEEWILHLSEIEGVAGQQNVWLAWAFYSNNSRPYPRGAWLDDISIWRHHQPSAKRLESCLGIGLAGERGLVLPALDPRVGGNVPLIREGRIEAATRTDELGAKWARLEFGHSFNQRYSDALMNYEFMLQTLCDHGIRILGLANCNIYNCNASEYNDLDNPEPYRRQFVNAFIGIARQFKDYIAVWEIWNEPNYPGHGGSYIDYDLYRGLLNATFYEIGHHPDDTVRGIDIVFGGLASAWGDSHDYFQSAYGSDNQPTLDFDYFAVHPYPNEISGTDPENYMRTDPEFPQNDTILDKFLKTMSDYSQGDKHIWVTEVGWNSSKTEPNRPWCQESVLVTPLQQQQYLTSGFSILFNEVKLWNSSQLAVDKVFWYQLMDVGIDEALCTTSNAAKTEKSIRAPSVYSVKMDSQQGFTWWFGLFHSDEALNPKPAACAFESYPDYCPLLFLPLISGDGPSYSESQR